MFGSVQQEVARSPAAPEFAEQQVKARPVAMS
jgi:hypothetical protein